MKQYLPMIAVAVIAILGTLFITSRTNRTPQEWRAKIEVKDSVIASIQRERDWQRSIYEDKIANLEAKDSIAQTKQKTIEYRIKTIPVIVRDMPDDDLKRAIEGLPNN